MVYKIYSQTAIENHKKMTNHTFMQTQDVNC